jgi:hypothetical protein
MRYIKKHPNKPPTPPAKLAIEDLRLGITLDTANTYIHPTW